MNKLMITLVLALAGTLMPPAARSQLPPPVDLGIQNILQETDVWCWAAVAQQIIVAVRGPGGTPPQCALVAMASNLHPAVCCQNYAACRRTGQLHEIQNLILAFGGRYSSLAQPADPMTLYQTLAMRRAVIMAVQSSPYSGHVVVIRGMAWVPTPMGVQPVLYINDPMSYFTQPVPFASIAQYWQSAIVVN